jgi:carbon monoxide dehydrogenase subunit G
VQLDQTFQVGRPIEEVWAALTDLAFVAECVPGARVTGRTEDGAFTGQMTVRLGSIRAAFEGTARLDEVDVPSRRVVLRAEGGGTQGSLRLEIRGQAVSRSASMTEVRAQTAVEMTGRIAQLGHGAAVAVVERLVTQMAQTLEQRLSGVVPSDPAGPALSVLPLLSVVGPALMRERRIRLAVLTVVGFCAGAARGFSRT